MPGSFATELIDRKGKFRNLPMVQFVCHRDDIEKEEESSEILIV